MGAYGLVNGAQSMGPGSPPSRRGARHGHRAAADFVALRLDHAKSDEVTTAIQMEFTDSRETWRWSC